MNNDAKNSRNKNEMVVIVPYSDYLVGMTNKEASNKHYFEEEGITASMPALTELIVNDEGINELQRMFKKNHSFTSSSTAYFSANLECDGVQGFIFHGENSRVNGLKAVSAAQEEGRLLSSNAIVLNLLQRVTLHSAMYNGKILENCVLEYSDVDVVRIEDLMNGEEVNPFKYSMVLYGNRFMKNFKESSEGKNLENLFFSESLEKAADNPFAIGGAGSRKRWNKLLDVLKKSGESGVYIQNPFSGIIPSLEKENLVAGIPLIFDRTRFGFYQDGLAPRSNLVLLSPDIEEYLKK